MNQERPTRDRIFIRDLHLRCIIGLKEEERRKKQDVIINIAFDLNLQKAGQSDDLADTIDYAGIKKKVVSLVEESSFLLVERLADQIAGACLDHPLVKRVRVTVDKPMALRFARSVAIEIERDK